MANGSVLDELGEVHANSIGESEDDLKGTRCSASASKLLCAVVLEDDKDLLPMFRLGKGREGADEVDGVGGLAFGFVLPETIELGNVQERLGADGEVSVALVLDPKRKSPNNNAVGVGGNVHVALEENERRHSREEEEGEKGEDSLESRHRQGACCRRRPRCERGEGKHAEEKR